MVEIDGTEIGNGKQPYIVAEMGASHAGDLSRAISIIKQAAISGANAIKFQAYEADDITIQSNRPDFIIKGGIWNGRNLYELYQVAQTPIKWYESLFAHAKLYEITIFASVFSPRMVKILENLGCPAYKIASAEITDVELIECAAKTGKPVIISTGMAGIIDINRAIGAVNSQNYALLHCVSDYPTDAKDAWLTRMHTLKLYAGNGGVVGISDHSEGIDIPIAATALGAHIIEKHIKLDDLQSSEDDAFALYGDEFSNMCYSVRNIYYATNNRAIMKKVGDNQFRRSLYVVKDVQKGEKFTQDNVRAIRPSYGMPPYLMGTVMTKVAARDIQAGEALKEEMLG